MRQIAKLGEILDRLVAAGATDLGDIEFLRSDPAKALDQARRPPSPMRGEGGALRAGGGPEPRPRRLDHRGRRLRPTDADGGHARGPGGRDAAADRAGRGDLRVRITVGFDIAP